MLTRLFHTSGPTAGIFLFIPGLTFGMAPSQGNGVIMSRYDIFRCRLALVPDQKDAVSSRLFAGKRRSDAPEMANKHLWRRISVVTPR